MPGPAEEVETVRWICRTFVETGKPEREIAAHLNERGIATDLGRLWTRGTVHQVLINEKYIGNNVWNRISYKLKKKRVRNDPDMWIRADGVFDQSSIVCFLMPRRQSFGSVPNGSPMMKCWMPFDGSSIRAAISPV